jgi:uncharacterized protein
MRTSNVIASLGLVGLAIGLSPAASFDGTRTPAMAPVTTTAPLAPNSTVTRAAPGAVPVPPGPALSAAPPIASQTPFDAFRKGSQSLREGRIDQGVAALEYAAGQGLPGAIWKLGRIYYEGDGVDKNELRAFEYFRNLTKAHAYDPPGTPHARFVADAFVKLGHFYLDGIANSEIKADPVVAYGMFRHAATYFGDPEAQYQVGRMHLHGTGASKDALQSARWLRLAADLGQRHAQGLLGSMLFRGTDVPRQAAMGLFWLTVAKDAVAKGGGGPADQWIIDTYWSAFAQATRDEREIALRYLENWMNARRP